MKKPILISEEIKRMKFLLEYESGSISEVESENPLNTSGNWTPQNQQSYKLPSELTSTGGDEFSNFPCIKSLKTITASTGNQSQGPVKMNVKFKDGGRYHFGSDGSLWSYGQRYGTFKCSTKPNTVILTVGGKETEYPLQGSQTSKIVFTKNEKLPLKFQQKGDNIKKMQEYLGLPKNLQTGNFYTRTESAIKKMFPEYNRSTGVTQEMYDQILGVRPGQRRKDLDTSFVPTERQTPTQTTFTPPPNPKPQQMVPSEQPAQPTKRQLRQANRLARRAQRYTNQ